MNVLVLDIAKSTGYAYRKDNGDLSFGTWQLYDKKSKFSEKSLIEHINKICFIDRIDFIIYETQGGTLNAHNNGLLKGALIQHLDKFGCDYLGISPRTWQKWVATQTGLAKTPKGKETKLMSVEFANTYYNLELKKTQHDIADALCLLAYYEQEIK